MSYQITTQRTRVGGAQKRRGPLRRDRWSLYRLGAWSAHMAVTLLTIGAMSCAPSHALAQTAEDATAGGSGNSLSPICTDRPTRANYACTVDDGRFQYETDIFNGSFLRLNGVTTDTWLVVNPTLKYGLTQKLDVEANLSPLELVRTNTADGRETTIAGVSDLYLRLKYQLVDSPGGQLQVALVPYLKAPTARPGLGDGMVEGGLILPVNYKLTEMLTLTTGPEVDVYKNSNSDGRHLNTAQLVNLAVSLPHRLTAYAELWGDWNFDPVRTVRQYSADFAVTYGVTSELQLDTGLNIGLNRQTPGVQVYTGVSQKF